jgi:hypothetical protein
MARQPLTRWCYFGCGPGSAGHYLFAEDRQTIRAALGSAEAVIEKWDGVLPPHPQRTEDLYRATISRVPGLGLTALAWWDRSQDSRVGGNSAIYAPFPEAGPNWLIEEGQRVFPWVFARLPQPLELWAMGA